MTIHFSTIRSRIAQPFLTLWHYVKTHKKISAAVLILLIGGGYYAYQKSVANATTAEYVLTRVANAPIQVTVTGSGEVSAEHQLDLTAKATGQVMQVNVHTGQVVTAGTIVAVLDTTDALKAIRDAKANLASAEISYQQSTQTSGSTVNKSSDAAYDAIVSTQTATPAILNSLNTIFYTSDTARQYNDLISRVEPSSTSVENQARASYTTAATAYTALASRIAETPRTANTADISALVNQSYQTEISVNKAANDGYAFLSLVSQTLVVHTALATPQTLATNLSNVSSYVSQTSSAVSSLLSAQSSLQSAIQSQSGTGTVTLDVASAQLAITKAQNALTDAQNNYENYVVRAPFGGTIANVAVQKYDQASVAVATLITSEQYATLSLNETDAAKVKVGQAATLTFDAIDGLTINGTVAEVNSVGTVTQSVVTYTMKIGFDTQDSRILPGMTVNATIITASKDSAIVVPNSAIKSNATGSYVQVATIISSSTSVGSLASTSPTRTRGTRTASTTGDFPAGFTGAGSTTASTTRGFAGTHIGASATRTVEVSQVSVRQVPVTLGLVNDTMSEIVSGLMPGEYIVTQSLNASGATAAKSTSVFSLFGGNASRGSGSGTARTGTTPTRNTGTGTSAATPRTVPAGQ
jgi:multidrug efflux pump subunit AcrA (membrane-fusion protein)